MARGPRHVLGLIGRYVVLLAAVGLVATVLYVAVDVEAKPLVARLAVAAVVAIVLVDLYGPLRRQLEEAPRSAFDQARQVPPAEPRIAPMVVRLRDSVRASVASQRAFEETLWPRLVRLSEARGTQGDLRAPRGRRWLRRGPSLRAIAELVRRLEGER